jgi:Fe2+ transport protein
MFFIPLTLIRSARITRCVPKSAGRSVLWGASLLGLIAAGALAQGKDVDVSTYPTEVQKAYRVFASRCSRCHDTSKALAASYSTDKEWQGVIRRMARMSGAAISPAEQDDIRKFLVFHTGVRSGKQTPATGTAEGRPAAPVHVEPFIVTRDGLRIEVLAREPQTLRRSHDGDWVTEAPRAEETLYLVVHLLDEETREKLPYAKVSARLIDGADSSTLTLAPALGPDGFHYGANLAAPAGRLRLSLTIEPPTLAQVGGTTLKLTRPVTVEAELDRR